MDSPLDKLVIRRLRTGDAEDIIKIYGAITQSPVGIDFRKVIEEQLLKPEDASFVAEVQGRVVGYMISHILLGGFGIEKSAWISMLGVAPKFMGQSVGQFLAEKTFQFYEEKGVSDIFTSVSWDSTDLLSFFKTLGFDRSNFINLRKTLT